MSKWQKPIFPREKYNTIWEIDKAFCNEVAHKSEFILKPEQVEMVLIVAERVLNEDL